MRRQLASSEIAKRHGISQRHARRLIAAEDERSFPQQHTPHTALEMHRDPMICHRWQCVRREWTCLISGYDNYKYRYTDAERARFERELFAVSAAMNRMGIVLNGEDPDAQKEIEDDTNTTGNAGA